MLSVRETQMAFSFSKTLAYGQYGELCYQVLAFGAAKERNLEWLRIDRSWTRSMSPLWQKISSNWVAFPVSHLTLDVNRLVSQRARMRTVANSGVSS